jgi:hypothetical protein
MTDDIQLSDQDQVDLALLNAVDEPLGRTVLEIWTEVLGNTEKMAQKRIEPGYASYVLKSWPQLVTIETLPAYYEIFHDLLLVYRADLEEQIRLHPDALQNIGAVGDEDSDAIANRDIYVELMFQWNLTTARLEEEWDVLAADAAPRLAAMADAQAYITGGTGIMQALTAQQVGFVWSNEDQEALIQRVVDEVESWRKED